MTPTDVSVLTETLPGSRVGLTIEVPPNQVDAAFERVLDRLGRRVKVQGFRPGKAPRALIEAKIGLETLREEVADTLLPTVLSQALEERDIEPIDRPQVEIEELDRGRPGRFRARVSVWPRVELPDLDSLSVERPHTEVKDEDVERRIDELRERLAEIEPVEREVRDADVVVGDLKVLVEDPAAIIVPPETVGRRELPDEARNGIELEVKEGVLVPELRAALVGHQVGDVVTADVEMPEDSTNPDMAGKKARLQVTIQGLKEKRVPELTDDVAKQLSDGAQETAEALRDAIRADLVENARRVDQLQTEQRAVQAVVEAARIEIPEALVDREVERYVENLDHRLSHQGMTLDRYLQYQGTTDQAFRANYRPEALGRVRTDLVLEEVGKVDGLIAEPTDDEVKDHMRREAERDQELGEDLDQFLQNEAALRFFRQRLSRLRIVEALAERLGGDATDVPKQEPTEGSNEATETPSPEERT
jgi:trigger factor